MAWFVGDPVTSRRSLRRRWMMHWGRTVLRDITAPHFRLRALLVLLSQTNQREA